MKKILFALAFVVPSFAFAQQTITDINSLATKLTSIGNLLTYLLVALAVIFIIWNVVMFLIKGNDPAARTGALHSILWGVVGLFIIVSIWGLVNILKGTFNTSETINGSLPTFGNSAGSNGGPLQTLPTVN